MLETTHDDSIAVISTRVTSKKDNSIAPALPHEKTMGLKKKKEESRVGSSSSSTPSSDEKFPHISDDRDEELLSHLKKDFANVKPRPRKEARDGKSTHLTLLMHSRGGITKETYEHEELTRKLLKIWEERGQGEITEVSSGTRMNDAKPCNAIFVLKNSPTVPHIDGKNERLSYTFCLGDFKTGGEMLVATPPGTPDTGNDLVRKRAPKRLLYPFGDDSRKWYEEGDEVLMRKLNCKGKLVGFDPRIPHATGDFSGGDRYAIIFYNRNIKNLKRYVAVKEELDKFGVIHAAEKFDKKGDVVVTAHKRGPNEVDGYRKIPTETNILKEGVERGDDGRGSQTIKKEALDQQDEGPGGSTTRRLEYRSEIEQQGHWQEEAPRAAVVGVSKEGGQFTDVMWEAQISSFVKKTCGAGHKYNVQSLEKAYAEQARAVLASRAFELPNIKDLLKKLGCTWYLCTGGLIDIVEKFVLACYVYSLLTERSHADIRKVLGRIRLDCGRATYKEVLRVCIRFFHELRAHVDAVPQEGKKQKRCYASPEARAEALFRAAMKSLGQEIADELREPVTLVEHLYNKVLKSVADGESSDNKKLGQKAEKSKKQKQQTQKGIEIQKSRSEPGKGSGKRADRISRNGKRGSDEGGEVTVQHECFEWLKFGLCKRDEDCYFKSRHLPELKDLCKAWSFGAISYNAKWCIAHAKRGIPEEDANKADADANKKQREHGKFDCKALKERIWGPPATNTETSAASIIGSNESLEEEGTRGILYEQEITKKDGVGGEQVGENGPVDVRESDFLERRLRAGRRLRRGHIR
jgi:hypothetical protein